MRFYVARTNYGGGQVSRYFSTNEKVKEWLEDKDNGEYYADYDQKIKVIPYEGCTGDDLRYWNAE